MAAAAWAIPAGAWTTKQSSPQGNGLVEERHMREAGGDSDSTSHSQEGAEHGRKRL